MAEGKPLRYISMQELKMPDNFNSDGIHPNDNGFKIMAKWWWVAIEYANKAGLIKAPKPFAEFQVPPVKRSLETQPTVVSHRKVQVQVTGSTSMIVRRWALSSRTLVNLIAVR
jgi:hypothetical protein